MFNTNRRYIPNQVTLLRHLLVFPFVLFFLHEMYVVAFVLYVTQESLDFLDGKLASYLSAKSKFGDNFDAFADLVCQLFAMLCLLSIDAIPVWFVLLVVYRETSIAYLRVLGERVATTISGEWQGKAKAFLYVIVLVLSLWNLAFGSTVHSFTVLPWIIAASVACVVSGAMYAIRYRQVVAASWKKVD